MSWKCQHALKQLIIKFKQNANNGKNAGQVLQNAYRKRIHKIECQTKSLKWQRMIV